jgi:hypothetical protein
MKGMIFLLLLPSYAQDLSAGVTHMMTQAQRSSLRSPRSSDTAPPDWLGGSPLGGVHMGAPSDRTSPVSPISGTKAPKSIIKRITSKLQVGVRMYASFRANSLEFRHFVWTPFFEICGIIWCCWGQCPNDI